MGARLSEKQLAIITADHHKNHAERDYSLDQQIEVLERVLDGPMFLSTFGNVMFMYEVDGEYSITVTDSKSILVFSFVGFQAQEITVGNQTKINVSLKIDSKALDEVVVVGYGVQKKKDLTGAVSSIGSEMFKERKETQVAQALQGAMSGVTVTRSGANGSMGSATIRIRGVTTIGDSNPLVIVDGVPVADVNQVNPNDIENLSVLKDAASASIYGSRAASGVILITTKRAKTDQASIQYNYENGFDKPTQLPDYMRASRYMELVNELRWNDAGNGANKFPTFSQDLLERCFLERVLFCC
jgi:TonB-dependent SusC/RagA subfamily outer membrane receptor